MALVGGAFRQAIHLNYWTAVRQDGAQDSRVATGTPANKRQVVASRFRVVQISGWDWAGPVMAGGRSTDSRQEQIRPLRASGDVDFDPIAGINTGSTTAA